MKKRFSEQNGRSTIFFRTVEILFSPHRKYGRVKIYGGVDMHNRENEFMQKCCDMLATLKSTNHYSYSLFEKHIGKIIGTMAYSTFWRFPRSLEINYDDVLDSSFVDFAGLIVCETTRARLDRKTAKRNRDLSRIYRICVRREIKFREEVMRKKMTEEEIKSLLQSKPWTAKRRNAMLQHALGSLSNI